MTECPACAGPQMPHHPAGVLAIDHTNTCTLRTFEDATQAADHDRDHYGRFSRPATPTEQVLLAALGYGLPPQLDTTVEYLTPGVRRRTWPTIRPTESETTNHD